jgi:hypothetical protein
VQDPVDGLQDLVHGGDRDIICDKGVGADSALREKRVHGDAKQGGGIEPAAVAREVDRKVWLCHDQI